MTDDLKVANQGGKKRSVKKPEIRIVLDTNQLYTGSASDLLRRELAILIEDCRRHHDVKFNWYIPEMVCLERRYQMLEAGKELLPPIKKLERLLGHNLGISAEILAERVNNAIQKQLNDLDLKNLPIDVSRVNWPQIIANAADRNPPFESGKHEKGFRDAIIAETFIQLINNSPKSSKSCRVAIVTNDDLLATAVESRTSSLTNVRILRSLDELKNLINTVVSDVTEEFVKGIREMARSHFFEEDNNDTLYYKLNVRDTTKSKFSSELNILPEGATERENGTWYISPPRFNKKKMQRVHWVTTITVAAKAIRRERKRGLGIGSDVGALLAGYSDDSIKVTTDQNSLRSGLLPAQQPTVGAPTTQSLLGAAGQGIGIGGYGSLYPYREVIVAEGQTVFEAYWSITVTKNNRLTNPKLDDVIYVDTTWDGGPV